jgi:hypothetical protein
MNSVKPFDFLPRLIARPVHVIVLQLPNNILIASSVHAVVVALRLPRESSPPKHFDHIITPMKAFVLSC